MTDFNKKVITKKNLCTIYQLLYVWCASVETQELAMLIKQNILTSEVKERIWDLIRLKRLNALEKSQLVQKKIYEHMHEQIQNEKQQYQQQLHEQNKEIILLQQKLKDCWLKQQHLMMLLLLLLQLFLCCCFFYSRS